MIEFHRSTKGLKPESILFYRDGVSEGQFSQVLQEEYTQIREVKNFYYIYKVKIIGYTLI